MTSLAELASLAAARADLRSAERAIAARPDLNFGQRRAMYRRAMSRIFELYRADPWGVESAKELGRWETEPVVDEGQ